jgi:GT2 family glycosyltransferase
VLLRRDCWRELGGFDEEFFLYYEDVDFCRRAHDAGWSVWFEPALHAFHHHPLHLRQVPPHIRLSTRHGLLAYSVKHWPGWQARALGWIVQVEARLRQWWANRQGDTQTAAVFGELAALASDFGAGRRARARRRLERVFRRV